MTVRDGVTDIIVRDTVLSGHDSAGIYLESSPQSAGGALLRALIEDSTITGNGFGRELTMIGNVIDGNDTNGLLTEPASGFVAPPFAFPPATICTNLQANEGGDRLLLHNATNVTFDFPPPATYTVGGDFFSDPASGGNGNPIVTSGAFGSRACQAAQSF